MEVQIHGPAAILFDTPGNILVRLGRQHALDNLQSRVVRIAAAVDEACFEPRLLHRAADRRSATVHNNRPHTDRFHKDNVDQHVPKRNIVFHHAAPQLDDRDLITKLTDPAECFDQRICFGDRFFQRSTFRAKEGGIHLRGGF